MRPHSKYGSPKRILAFESKPLLFYSDVVSADMELGIFRRVFQDIQEPRALLIRYLSGASLIALRKAIGFWLSEGEKTVWLSLLWDVFEHIDWCGGGAGVLIMGWGLDYHQAETLLMNSAVRLRERIAPFAILVRPFAYQCPTLGVKEMLARLSGSTRIMVSEGETRGMDFWDTRSVATIEGFVTGLHASIPVIGLAQKTCESQLGHAAMDRAVATSILRPVNDTLGTTIARFELGHVTYAAAYVTICKNSDLICIYISASRARSYIINIYAPLEPESSLPM